MIQHIMFDFDGTLADTKEGIIKSMHYAFDQLHISRVEEKIIADTIGPPLEEMFSIFLKTQDHELIQRGVELFRKRYRVKGVRELELYPAVKETLEKLKAEGKKLYIVTSKPEVFVRQICKEYDIINHFTDITGVSTQAISLSKGKRMRLLMEQHGFTRENAVMVGDRPEDARAAAENSIRCIGMSYGYSTEHDLRQAGCDKIGNGFEQIIELID